MNAGTLVPRQNLEFSRTRIVKSRISRELSLTILIGLCHLPLGVLLYNAGPLALLHPIAIFSLGVVWAFQKRTPLDRVALAVSYLIGAEVLWRMAKTPVPWEFGKYGSAVILSIALIRRRPFKIPNLPVIYFLVLLPACIFTFAELNLGNAREQVSSNLSGPLLLAFSCWFFANLELPPLHLRRLLFAILIPLLSVACTTLFYTVTADDIQFTTESNFATSGGFGPNQVSSMLGLGLFVAICSLVSFKLDTRFKILLGASAVFFAAQSALTFSRGGIYNSVGASLALIFFHFRKFADGAKRITPVLILIAVSYWFVFPVLDNFTDGKLKERFEDTGTSHRTEIARSDLEIFLEFPIWGTGVGLSDDYRRRLYGYGASNHTEFSRLISEHGFFGLAALVSLVGMALVNFRRQRSILGRALVAGVSVWCVLFMINAGMRLAAPSYLWGMAFVTIRGRRRRRRPILSAT